MQKLKQNSENNNLSLIQKLPFVQTAEHLHRYNVHVTEICHQTNQKNIENYNFNKANYQKKVMSRELQRAKATYQMEDQKKKLIADKNRLLEKRNQQNLSRLQLFQIQRKDKRAKKQKKLMEASMIRRQSLQGTLNQSFHHSPDRRNCIRQRQNKQLQRSMQILAQNKNRFEAANQRRAQLLQDLKDMLRIKNSEEVLDLKENETKRERSAIKKIISKYETNEKHLLEIENIALKRIENKKKEDQSLFEKINNKQIYLKEEINKKGEEYAKKYQQKIQKVMKSKQENLQLISQSIHIKRKLKQQKLMLNTVCLGEENIKKVKKLDQKLHSSQIFLTTLQKFKQKMHIDNLYDTVQYTLRT